MHPLNTKVKDEKQLQSAKETELNDIPTLEALAQAALASSPSNQDLAQMKRTSFVAFPPKISEKSITFEMPVLFFVHEVNTPNPEVSHNTTSEVVNLADLNLETDKILALPDKGRLTEILDGNSETDIPNGDLSLIHI